MPHFPRDIEYSDKYQDDVYEYRHVFLPKEEYEQIQDWGDHLLTENEWRRLGITQSKGWQHYAIFKPEPYILFFRRPLGTDGKTGKVPEESLKKIQEYNMKRKQHFDSFGADY